MRSVVGSFLIEPTRCWETDPAVWASLREAGHDEADTARTCGEAL